ncbi:hypothetical protein CEP51_000814 [Fusarium floridanum]|uniref:Uncharacterized protein n=1 Tax=Fusarium floridanum TaxID=1325733 RepID=A0A428SKQ6_9HYPO|nr:hypothetical protein CEP51_000814 [Fusarium floridanum]
MMDQQYAYVTGAASGCGLAISTFLVEKGVKVFLADFDEKNLRVAAEQLRSPFAVVNVADWESQVKGFKEAVSQFGRIDYVYPIAGIGENSWIPPLSSGQLPDDFAKPNLSIIEINITGLLYSIALALQQFRRQDLGKHGYRGKILCPGSIMGIYPCAGNPIYNTSKHAVTGLSSNPNPDGGVLYAFTQPTPDFSDYHSWYNTEHGPLRVALDFIEGGNRYECYYADPQIQLDPPIYLAMYELGRLSGLNERPYQALTDDRSTREDDVFRNRLTFLERRIYKNISTRGTYSGPAPVLLTVAFVIKDEHVDEFNRWYEEEHTTDVSKVPGWRRTRRFVAVEANSLRQGGQVVEYDQIPEGHSEFIAIHDFDAENGLEGPEFEYAQTRPWRQKILGLVKGRDHRRFKHIHEFKAGDYVKPE